MRGSPELPNFDPAAFNSEFFANYNQKIANSSIEDQAATVLAGILSIRVADGTERTYEQIRDDTRAFFSMDNVKQDMALMQRMSIQFAQACMGHNHGSELARDEQLGSIFDHGINSIFGEKADHKHDLHDKLDEDKKRKKAKGASRQALRVVMGSAIPKKSAKLKQAA
jgi:hypothetical protein